jgi:hypothetical protein
LREGIKKIINKLQLYGFYNFNRLPIGQSVVNISHHEAEVYVLYDLRAHLSPSEECCNIERIKQAWKGAERENASLNLNIEVIWWYGSSCMTQ